MLVHAIAWTLIPVFLYPYPPVDTVEMLYWGQQWQWGYYKHPPLPPWMAELGWQAAGGHVWGVYIVAQLTVLATFWAIWDLATRTLPARHAIAALLLLACIPSLNAKATDFNHNVALTATIALSTAFFHRALTGHGLLSWAAAGVCFGLGFLSKYPIVTLLPPMGLIVLLNRDARRHLRSPGPYIATAFSLAVAGPHLAWLIQNDFVPLNWANRRMDPSDSHMPPALRWVSFLGDTLNNVAPMALAALPLVRWRRGEAAKPEPPIRSGFDRRYILWMGLGPFAVHLLMFAVSGAKMREAWTLPLLTMVPMLVFVLVPVRSFDRLPRAFVAAVGAACLFWTAQLLYLTLIEPQRRQVPVRSHLQASMLVRAVSERWQTHCSGPVPLVIGDDWLAPLVAMNLPGRPPAGAVLKEPDVPDAERWPEPWATVARVKETGAVIVWWMTSRRDPTVPARFAREFSNLIETPPVWVPWLNWRINWLLPVGVAIVPPPGAATQCKPEDQK